MRVMIHLFFVLSLTFLPTRFTHTQEQPSTSEQMLEVGESQAATPIGGYGNAFYQHDANADAARVNFERFVLFIGHRFSEKISFFSELEVEDAKLEGGEPGGEVALEQAYLKFILDRNTYIVAGLFIPRIGILNEDHLPNRYNGNERPLVERYVIPSTWRELGVGLYGNLGRIPLRYNIAVVNGLNSGGFEHGSGIRGGRYEGREASANNLAVTGALQFQAGDLRLQVSGYGGGSVGLPSSVADTMGLASGIFATPVLLGEAHARYEKGGLQAKLLGTIVSIPEAASINAAFANNTPQRIWGAYAELGYDVLSAVRNEPPHPQLVAFVRLERFDLNATIPANGVTDPTLNQTHVIGGLTYLPHPNVVVKADIRLAQTGDQNQALTGGPAVPSYESRNTFVNLGIGFSF